MRELPLKKELYNFLDADGKLKSYPAKFKLKAAACFYLASKFEASTLYTEKEVNALINAWHVFADWSMLRRDMCDMGFLCRELNGSTYWLNESQPTLESLGLI